VANIEMRVKAASLIRSYLNGEISNHDFADNFPRDKSDSALEAVEKRLWLYYDDVRTHHCKFPPDSAEEVLFRRCALFLNTSLEYEWPDLSHHNLAHPIVGILTGGLFRFRAVQKAKSAGNYGVWPFIRKTDFEEANAKFNAGGVPAREDLSAAFRGRADRVRFGISIGIAILQTILFVVAVVCAFWGVTGHSGWLVKALICFVLCFILLGVGSVAQPFARKVKNPKS
jgi:hypothetical protein